jgi:hypothetical protein
MLEKPLVWGTGGIVPEMIGYGYQAETAFGKLVGDTFWRASRVLAAPREFCVDVRVKIDFH